MPKLTDQEQQEIVRFIEAGQPLPDKYRFLLFGDKREVELVWNGKTNEVCNVVLPFQVIEQVDEPRAEKPDDNALQPSLFTMDNRGRQLKGWTNKLIWVDNKLILSSLKNGPLRAEIEAQGGLKLIYIDPPFDVGADFSMDIEIGDDTFLKKPNILEEIAYRDTWGRGADSFIAMIYERLMLMRDLLAEDGSIYVHCDWRVNGLIRLVLDDVFLGQFHNHIVWSYGGRGAKSIGGQFPRNHDDILLFSKNRDYQFRRVDTIKKIPFNGSGYRLDEVGRCYRTAPRGMYTDESIKRLEAEGRIMQNSKGTIRIKYFEEYDGNFVYEKKQVGDVWEDIPDAMHMSTTEKTGYGTQKPEALLERILRASSNEGDLVADFFCGSGTTAAVAEKLGRKWLVCDLGKFAIHTTRKRLIGVQRQLKTEGQDYRAFEILNLGKYERQHYVGVNPSLREEEQRKQAEEKEAAFLELILRAYQTQKTEGFASFHGKKAGRLVSVGPINLPVTRLFVEAVMLECRQKHITKVDILGFEFEMGLFPNVLDDARNIGIDLALKYIPRDVFDKRAVEKHQVVFHDVAAIEVKPLVKKNSVAVQLTDFSVFYSQDSVAHAEATLKDKARRIVVEQGQIVKVSKDAKGIVKRTVLTKKWTDWIDYWSVDFDFQSKREIVRVQREDNGGWEERWTGDYIFENEWQSFRTKKDRSLELTSAYHECLPGRHKLAVKVVDIFGNDTMTIVEVAVGGKK